MIRFEMKVETKNPKFTKVWGKKIEEVDTTKNGGFAFLGKWTSKSKAEGSIFGRAPEGTIVLGVLETGTNKYRCRSYVLCRVAEGGEDKWMDVNTIHFENLEVIEILECENGEISPYSLEIVDRIGAEVDEDITYPLNALKYIAFEHLQEKDEKLERMIEYAHSVCGRLEKLRMGHEDEEKILRDCLFTLGVMEAMIEHRLQN